MKLFEEILEKFGQSSFDFGELEKIISSELRKKKVLVTGAAGSIGLAVVRRLAAISDVELGLLDINETGIADLKFEIEAHFHSNAKLFLSDISNDMTLQEIFEIFKPDIVIHCAAYKHIVVLESFPKEAFRVNVLGTHNLLKLSHQFNVRKFLLISSDKAVNPLSILGYSKRISEILVRNYPSESATKFMVIRLPNIIGSRGSLTEIIQSSLKNGHTIFLTDKEMYRYFISSNTAVNGILKVIVEGKNRCLYAFSQLTEINLPELVDKLLHEHFMVKKDSYTVVFTGKRIGEKLKEDMLYSDEKNSAEFLGCMLKIDLKNSPNLEPHIVEKFKLNSTGKTKEILKLLE